MNFGPDFFALQLRFARRVAVLSGLPLETALLDYTNLYVRFALGRAFNAGHPVWRDYLAGLAGAADAEDWTYRFFLTRPPVDPRALIATAGCFSCGDAGGDGLRLHFDGADADGGSPLRQDRQDVRRTELRALLERARTLRPDARRVLGVSWLYNLPAYRRLFPPSYLATARVAKGRLRNMPLWGQFLDRHGAVRQAGAATLFERLSHQMGMDGLAACFPLQPLAVEAPLSAFEA